MGQEVENLTQCGLCMEEITKKSHPDSCKHLFCFECLKKWSKDLDWGFCPWCRIRYISIIYFDEEMQEYEIYDDLTRSLLDVSHDSERRAGRHHTFRK